ncbi:DUF423 domain-containing protein [Rhodocyclaceae bacterium SMB388]
MSRIALLSGSLLAALGVALGAFGAHGLRGMLGPIELAWWHTAVQYQMWHAVGLVALGACPLRRVGPAILALGAGTVLFSGTLYLLALTGMRWLGMLTPIGGALMILGWSILAWRAWRD